jgi:hypothetical protein
MNVTSDFVLLDVKEGRHQLKAHFSDNLIGPCQPELHLPVVIEGYIYGAIGHDDGVSIEFGVNVTDVTIASRPVQSEASR